MAVSRKELRPWTVPSGMCECCGRIVVFLRRNDWSPKRPHRVVCYAKGWDGNIWYVVGTHKKHPVKWYARHMAGKREPEDPFFSLD